VIRAAAWRAIMLSSAARASAISSAWAASKVMRMPRRGSVRTSPSSSSRRSASFSGVVLTPSSAAAWRSFSSDPVGSWPEMMAWRSCS